jgi:hypothetical protein
MGEAVMNLPSRVDFIYELVDAVKRDVIDKADLMPDEWDGEELRRWHNKDVQIGDEGEKANETPGAVLNPALLTIK